MRILVLGGSLFLSREVVLAALARGHEVVCACRGSSGAVPEGATHVVLDRAADTDPEVGPWAALAGGGYDAVVDVAGTPSWVRTALAALSGAGPHWVFVSTISVYADLSRRGGGVGDTPVLAAAAGDPAGDSDPTAYGRSKVACEQAVTTATDGHSLVVRPGLIVGPGDPSGRFTYWPVRLAAPGPVLAPGPAEDPVQVIDVRDLAQWLVQGCERGLVGTFDAVAPARRRQDFLADVAQGVGEDPELVWAEPSDLAALDVRPWAGERALPVWVPLPELVGMLDRDVGAALRGGMTCRPLAQTARDTLAWVRASTGARVGGLTTEQERLVLEQLTRSAPD
ncbi:MAG: hypothetical protein M3519_09885 [Actinomycetota bacterium]|nr:hypothetical protein [Actinomycetota bacterium]